MKSRFITFEGTEGAGKSSIIEAVKIHLENKGFKVIITREPGGIRISEKIRDIILDVKNVEMDAKTEALLYAASRRQHVVEKILPALKEKYIVLCDRYVDSSLVYQGLARGLGVDEVYELNKFAIDDLLPDKTFFINVRPEVGLKRIEDNSRNKNRLDLEKLSFHKIVYDGYISLMNKYKDRFININGEQSQKEVIKDVLDWIEKI